MARLSERISTAVSTVECPGCGKRVSPVVMAPPSGPNAAAPTSAARGPEDRWSFIWTPPSGNVCPECFFPLDRYVRRLKWVRTLQAGLVLLVAAVMLLVLSLVDRTAAWAGTAARIVAAPGAVALVLGLAGIVIGGRTHRGDPAGQ